MASATDQPGPLTPATGLPPAPVVHPAPARPWIAAGWLAVAATCTVAFAARSLPVHGGFQLIIALVSGWCAFLMLATWWWMRRLHEDQLAIRALAERLRAINLEDRRESLSSVLLDRPDEFGDLSRAIHDCLAKAIASQAEARMLHRTMRDTIDRRTRMATAKLEREAVSDALTGVGNRRALDEIARSLRSEADSIAMQSARRVVGLMIDMDRFKAVNDTLGHDAGDECLVFLASLLRSTVRAEDTIVRLGGDEFLVLMRDATLDQATTLAARLRALFAQMPWSYGDVPRPTLSIGVADVALNGPEALETLLRDADEALYTSKRHGRDRVSATAPAA